MADDLEDLDEAVRRHDPDRWLASRFVADADQRADIVALYAFNHEIARVAVAVKEPLMGEIRLTWWSEAIAEIFENRPVRRHPVSLALETAIRRRDLPREPLEGMIEARYPELYKEPVDVEASEGALMGLVARVLGVGPHPGFSAAARGDFAQANRLLKDLPAPAFPAVAHIALRRNAEASAFARRARITWAVMTGKI